MVRVRWPNTGETIRDLGVIKELDWLAGSSGKKSKKKEKSPELKKKIRAAENFYGDRVRT